MKMRFDKFVYYRSSNKDELTAKDYNMGCNLTNIDLTNVYYLDMYTLEYIMIHVLASFFDGCKISLLFKFQRW